MFSIRHAPLLFRVAAVHVVLERSEKAVRLMVRSEGRGFEPDEATSSNGPGEKVGLSPRGSNFRANQDPAPR
jgi:signal transduction histidine kinase